MPETVGTSYTLRNFVLEIQHVLPLHSRITTQRRKPTRELGRDNPVARRLRDARRPAHVANVKARQKSTHIGVEVGNGLRNGLDLSAAEVSEPPRHGGVRDELLVDVVVRGFHRLRLSEVQARHLLLG